MTFDEMIMILNKSRCAKKLATYCPEITKGETKLLYMCISFFSTIWGPNVGIGGSISIPFDNS